MFGEQPKSYYFDKDLYTSRGYSFLNEFGKPTTYEIYERKPLNSPKNLQQQNDTRNGSGFDNTHYFDYNWERAYNPTGNETLLQKTSDWWARYQNRLEANTRNFVKTLVIGTGKFLYITITGWNPQLREGKTPLSWWRPYERYSQKVDKLGEKYFRTSNLLTDPDVRAVATLPLYAVPYLGEGLLIYGGVKSGIEIYKKPTPANIGYQSLPILGGVAGTTNILTKRVRDVSFVGKQYIPQERIIEQQVLKRKWRIKNKKFNNNSVPFQSLRFLFLSFPCFLLL